MVKVNHIEAVDDKGKKIRVIEDAETEKYSASKLVELKLEAIERQTKSINIEGELLYFTPTITNNERIVIQNFKDSQENVIVKASSEIKFTLISNTDFLNLETNLKHALNEKLTQEEELSDEEYDAVKATQRELQRMTLSVRDYPKTVLNFEMDLNPEEFYSIIVYNDEDREIPTDYRFAEGVHQIILGEKTTKNSYIEILLENENSIETIDFQLENILLP